MNKQFKQFGLLGVATLALLACSKNEEENKAIALDPASISCYYLDSTQVKVVNGEGTYQWSSDDNYVAFVDSISGLVRGFHIGTTTIRAKQGDKSATCAITVNPRSQLYKTPYMEWGATQQQVIAKLGQPDTIIDSQLIYMEDQAKGIQLNYFIKDDALVQVGVLAFNSNYWEELAQYLVERYINVDYDNNVLYYINSLDVKSYSLLVTLRPVAVSSTSYVMQVSYLKGNSTAAPARQVMRAAIR